MKAIIINNESSTYQQLIDEHTEHYTYSFNMSNLPTLNGYVFINKTMKEEFDELENILKSKIQTDRKTEIIDKYELTLSDLDETIQFWKKQTQLYGPLDFFEYKFFETKENNSIDDINEYSAKIYGGRDEDLSYLDLITNRGINISEQKHKPILRNDISPTNGEYEIFNPTSFHTTYSNLDYLMKIYPRKCHAFAYGFNLLLREELIVQTKATRSHRFILTCKEMSNLYNVLTHIKISERIRETFPYSTISRMNMYAKSHDYCFPIFDADRAYTYVQDKYKNILSYFPKKTDIIASVHGSNILYSMIVSDMSANDLDIRICSSDGTMLKPKKFEEYVSELIANLKVRAYNFRHVQYSPNKYTLYFKEFSMDVYNSLWGAFNMYHVPMVRGDLQFLPTVELCGTFTFFYSLLTGIGLDIRYTPTNPESHFDIIDKYATRKFLIYCSNRIIEELYISELNHKRMTDFIPNLGIKTVLYKGMGIARFNISNILRFVYGDYSIPNPNRFINIATEIDMNRNHVIVYYSDKPNMYIDDTNMFIYFDQSRKFYGIYYSKDDLCLYSTDYKNIIEKGEFRISPIKYKEGYSETSKYKVIYKHRTYVIKNSIGELFALHYDVMMRRYRNIPNYIDFLRIMKDKI